MLVKSDEYVNMENPHMEYNLCGFHHPVFKSHCREVLCDFGE